jgi:hypothetical protein
VDRLRRLLRLSADATIEQVCDDAARLIEGEDQAVQPVVLEGDGTEKPRGRRGRSAL